MTSAATFDYVIVVQAPAYRLSDDAFATESAFAIHLRELRAALGPAFRTLVLLAPRLTDEEYARNKDHLDTLTLARDGIEFVPAHSTHGSLKEFWLTDLPRVTKRLSGILAKPCVVHSGMSDDFRRPLMAVTNLIAWRRRQPVVFIVDIDFRQDTRRYYQLGMWRPRRYLAHRFAFDPVKWAQVWLAPRMFQLVLLKSSSMVRDFGRGRPHVKNFYDTVHSTADILPAVQHAEHLERLGRGDGPLRIVYFGRFVEYKGLKNAIEAVRIARRSGADVRLTLIGNGECFEDLRQQATAANLGDAVVFEPPVRYGPALFDLLRQAHLTVATPLVEDTPRAAFDSMARGLPLIAFDINYFRDLARESGAVKLVKWADAESLATGLLDLYGDRAKLVSMAERGLKFAAANTQAIWLERRVGWVTELLGNKKPVIEAEAGVGSS